MSRPNTPSWPVIAGALIVVGCLGFGVAKLTSHPAPAPEAAPAPTAAPAELAIEASHLDTMKIAVEPVSVGVFGAAIQASGSVVSSPGAEAVVTAQASGALVRLEHRLGDQVRAGETLALVSSREATAMASARAVADAKAALARSTFAREKRLFEQKVTPRQDLDAAQAALAAAEAEARGARNAAAAAHVSGDGRGLAVVSPIAGRITAQSAVLGAFVEPQTELFHVADTRFVQIEAHAPPQDAARVRPGDAARVVAGAGTYPATVRSVTPTLDRDTRSATIVLTLTDSASTVTPGEAVQVQLSPQATGPAGVIVPDEAVLLIAGRDVVFVRTPTGFRIQPVVIAERGGGRVSIRSGLSAGQSIATRNAFLLKAEATKSSED